MLRSFILGKFIPEGDKIVFKESYVTKAIRDGGAVVFEEINFAILPKNLSHMLGIDYKNIANSDVMWRIRRDILEIDGSTGTVVRISEDVV